jgi:hypothetical protein
VDAREKHSVHSALRENIIEHIFIGEVLRRLWEWGIMDAEILKSEFDAGGYDLVLSCRNIMRHIQMKVGRADGARDAISANLRLAEKPSGCIVWILVDDDLQWKGFRWFGGLPGQPLPDIGELKVASHAKGTSEGVKNERPNHRLIKRGAFVSLASFDALLFQLLGAEILRPDVNGVYISAARSQDFLYDGEGLPL